MGIVHSKVLGGSNLYGSSDGKGIVDVGKGAYRYVLFWCIIYDILCRSQSQLSHYIECCETSNQLLIVCNLGE